MTPGSDPLDEALRRHYAELTLDGASLREIRSTTERSFASPHPGGVVRRGRGPLVVMAVACLLLLAFWIGERRAASRVTDLVVAEIALNHAKALDPDVLGDHPASVGASMTKLDFVPVDPERGLDPDDRTLGGRYCSLNGAIASQFRLVDAQGRRLTLYQVRDQGDLKRVRETEVFVDGLRVRIWREKGLLLGLASGS